MEDIQKLQNKVAEFWEQLTAESDARLIQQIVNDIDVSSIFIPFSKDKEYPCTEIKVHEGKVIIIGETYKPEIYEAAKKFFGAKLRK